MRARPPGGKPAAEDAGGGWLGAWIALALGLVGIFAAGAQDSGSDLPLHGRVLDLEGRGVAAAKVVLLELPSAYRRAELRRRDRWNPAPVATARTGADGSFELRAPAPGAWQVLVRGPGGSAFSSMVLALPGLSEGRDLPSVVLEPTAAHRFCLSPAPVDPRELQGVRVLFEPEVNRHDLDSFPKLEPGARRWVSFDWRPRSHLLNVDSRGCLRVRLGRFAPWKVYTWSPRFGEGAVTTLEGGAPGGEKQIPWREPGETPPSGHWRLEDPEGVPLAGVVALAGEGRWPVARSDAEGRIKLPASAASEGWRLLRRDGAATELEASAGAASPDPVAIFTWPRRSLVEVEVEDATKGGAVAGALIWTREDPGAAVRADLRGSARLAGPDRGLPRLQASAAGLRLRSADRVTEETPGRRSILVELEPAVEIQGRLLDDTGSGVAGVAVLALEEGWDPPWSYRPGVRVARSRADGRFRLGGLAPAGRLTLTALVEGYAPLRAEVSTPEAGELGEEVSLQLEPGRRLRGRVADPEGRALAGAEVRLYWHDAEATSSPLKAADPRTLADHPDALTGPQGGFAVDGLRSGTYEAVLFAAGYAPRRISGIEVPAAASPTDLGTWILERGVQVEGRIVDPQGRPLEGATVEASASSLEDRGSASGPLESRTGPQGRFEAEGFRRGELVLLSISREGYIRRSGVAVMPPTPEPVVVELQPASTVAGVVEDEAGAPVKGAWVGLRAEGGKITAFRGVHRTSDAGVATSDEGGRFELAAVPPGTYRVRVEHDDFLPTLGEAVRVGEGETHDSLNLVLHRGSTVRGRVVDGTGDPVPRASVRLRRGSGGDGGAIRSTIADARGEFLISGLESGAVLFTVRKEAFVDSHETVEIAAREVEVELVLRRGLSVAGTVVEDSGQGAHRAWVTLVGTDDSVHGSGVADERGRFLLEGLPPGRHTLKAERSGLLSASADVVLNPALPRLEGVTLRLRSGTLVHGRVLGLKPAPIQGGEVEAIHRGGEDSVSASIDGLGFFRLGALAPGGWLLNADMFDGRHGRLDVDVDEGVRRMDVEIQLEAGFELRGRLIRTSPVASATMVGLIYEGQPRGVTVVGFDGSFDFRDLPSGRYSLMVLNDEGRLMQWRTVRLTGDLEVELEIGGRDLEGVVIDATSRGPLEDARVELVFAGAEGASLLGVSLATLTSTVHTDSTGRFVFQEAFPGPWSLRASRDGYSTATVAVNVAEEDPPPLTLALEPSGGLRFQVTTYDGRTPAMVEAVLVDADGRVAAAEQLVRHPDGTFVWTTAAAGAFDLLVAAQGSPTASVPVRPPGDGPVVRLPPPARLRIHGTGEMALRSVTLRDSRGLPYRALAESGGVVTHFPVGGETLTLPAGTWQVFALTEGGDELTGTVQLPPLETVLWSPP